MQFSIGDPVYIIDTVKSDDGLGYKRIPKPGYILSATKFGDTMVYDVKIEGATILFLQSGIFDGLIEAEKFIRETS